MSDSAGGEVDLSMLSAEAQETRAIDRVIEHPVPFELSEARLEQLVTAQERLGQVEDEEAALARRLDVREGRFSDSRDEIGPVVDRLQGSEATRRAIEGAQLSVRDYVLGTFALQQAVLAQRAPSREAFAEVLLHNVAVVERNPDRVTRLTDGTPFARIVETSAGGEVEDINHDSAGIPRVTPVPPAAALAPSRSGQTTAPRRAPAGGDAPRLRDDDDRAGGNGKAKGRGKGKAKGKDKGRGR